MSIKACQTLINSGSAWTLEGHVGRTCMQAIADGACMLGTRRQIGPFGDRIPSRFDVVEGTRGSRGYVISINGEEHADMLEGISGAPSYQEISEAVMADIED